MKFFLFTNIASHYRASLWALLLKNPIWEIHFFFGSNSNSGIQPINFSAKEFSLYKNQLHQLKNFWIKGKILIWQKGVIGPCFKEEFDQAIFLGEMYCLSTWLAAIICRLRGVRVVFWGHGIYGNEGRIKLFIRKIFYHLAHQHLLYERRAKKIMHESGFNPNNLYVVFNSLDYDTHKTLRIRFQNLNKSDVFTFFSDPLLPVIVFIGRLTAVKKLDLLLDAVKLINSESVKVNLLFIGEGPERKSLEFDGQVGLVKRWLYFRGACYNEEIIGKYLYASDLCVSPGNVGLTAIHSLSLGTPVATHDNLNNQMPEAEAITEGYNGFFFKENDIKDLKTKVENWLKSNTNRNKIREQCYEIIDKYYNPYYQFNVFNKIFSNKRPEV
jgi:glycosyltransferase involved in cell wall biosynthesis